MRVLFDWLRPANFMPHGHCYLWRPDVLWLRVGSDTLIALSYCAIPVAGSGKVWRLTAKARRPPASIVTW
jgi:hypothetical protein